MTTTRMIMGVLTAGILAATALASSAMSQTAPVEQVVERLRQVMIDPDRTALESLAADQLSYGHSDGRVQTKAELIDALVTKRS